MSSQLPFSDWTPGSALAGWREIVFGGYVFPLTAQEDDRDVKLGKDRRKIVFNFGEYIPQTTSLAGRDITVVADVGSGLVGTQGNTLVTQDDLEAERSLLATLHGLGNQPLWVRPDRYLNAMLDDFDFAFFKDGGAYRYANWKLKFIAQDPRYYSTSQTSTVLGPFTDSSQHTATVSHLGNSKAFPIVTFTGACNAPTFQIAQGLAFIQVRFSALSMAAGDTLVVYCDPRPEYREICATYTPNGGSSTNALVYINPAGDFGNNLNAQYFFPYIESSNIYASTQTLGVIVGSSVSPNYTVTFAYNDTWI